MAKGAKTGGRTKGTPNRNTLGKQKAHAELVEKAKQEGETPLECMLRLMRDEKQPPEVQRAMAVAAAPYCHPRLAAVEHSGTMAITHDEAVAMLENDMRQSLERPN